MTGPVTTKLRLVKCPKCRRVLPELANVPVYQCGGCGTVLQAKTHIISTEDADSHVHELDSVQENEPKNLSSNIEARNLIEEEETPHFTTDTQTEKNYQSNQIENSGRNGENSGNDQSSNELSVELVHDGTNGSIPVVSNNDECSIERVSGSDLHIYEEEAKRTGVISSDVVVYPTELNTETNQREYIEVSAPIVETTTETIEHPKSHSISGSSIEEDLLDENMLIDNMSRNGEIYDFERVSSIDTLDHVIGLREMPESPITRSFYGNYESGSSCEGTDDQVSDQKLHLGERKFKAREFDIGKNATNYADMQGQNGNYSSSSSENRRFTHHGFPDRPRFPYIYNNRSNDDTYTRFHSPNMREDLEMEKSKLLEMVQELQNQLNRTNISEVNYTANNRLGEKNHEFSPYSCDDISDDSLRKIHIEAIKVRTEKHYSGKKIVRSVIGGAPFLRCYNCSEILQMPSDFVLFKRKYHQLKCGGCSFILKFSVRNGNNIVRYVDIAPKVVAEESPYADPVSIDDFGPSFCKSVSTEEGPSSIEPKFENLKRNSSKKGVIFKQTQNKIANFVKSIASVRSSSKKSTGEEISESEEVARSNSPLHRLMGYHSATYILNS